MVEKETEEHGGNYCNKRRWKSRQNYIYVQIVYLVFYSIMVKIGKLEKNYGRILLSKQDGINEQGGFFFEFFKRAG